MNCNCTVWGKREPTPGCGVLSFSDPMPMVDDALGSSVTVGDALRAFFGAGLWKWSVVSRFVE